MFLDFLVPIQATYILRVTSNLVLNFQASAMKIEHFRLKTLS